MIVDLHISQDETSAGPTGPVCSAMPSDTFEIFIDDDRYAVPTLYLVTAASSARAVSIAERMVAESPHHLGAELCLEGRRIAGIGSFAVRQLPDNRPYREPDES